MRKTKSSKTSNSYHNFLIDHKLADELYTVFDRKKIIQNCKDLETSLPTTNEYFKISIGEKLSFVSIRENNGQVLQFLFSNQFNVYELLRIPDHILLEKHKALIFEAYGIRSCNSIEDLTCLFYD
ncbi:hypothetical protein [Mangrovimonas aestuarii]|uniref:hypothetical protein n=1 Tax=Mangrovimonas aestuarii TaxID=3018443 RepID=UPI0023790AC0|nr:hypothetical protein [Mangrovimonas aestuarii]